MNGLAYCITLAMLDLLTLLTNIRLSLNSCREEQSSLLLCSVNARELPTDLTLKYQNKLKMVVESNGLAYCITLSMLETYRLTILANIKLR
jgi:hypothetical protein